MTDLPTPLTCGDRTSLLALFAARSIPVDATRDNVNSISSNVLRLVLDGQRTVAIGSESSAHDQLCSLLDLLSLHLSCASVPGSPVTIVDEVTVVVGRDPAAPTSADEALSALRTLRDNLAGGPRVRVLVWDGGSSDFVTDTGPAPDYSQSAKAADYLTLLERVSKNPPVPLRELARGMDIDGLRAYPMLTGHPAWSLRLEGLEIGRIRDELALSWLDVGRSRNDADGPVRTIFRDAVREQSWFDPQKHAGRLLMSDIGTTNARLLVRAFATRMEAAPSIIKHQNEHALESRILRGDCLVALPTGETLDLLKRDGLVNWGSQFPTRWGDTKTKAARYLDALLHVGPVPYAVEIKVESQGVGKYYRHAVAQAVLYRHFIRTATPVHPWFAARDLSPRACEAIVVVPRPTAAAAAAWVTRHRQLSTHFNTEIVEVDRNKAYSSDRIKPAAAA